MPAVGQVREDLTPSILLRPSRTANAASIRITPGNKGQVHGDTQTGFAGEDLFFLRRRADATSRYVSALLMFVFQRSSASPFRLRRRLGSRPAINGTEAMVKADGAAPLLSSPK